MNTFFAANVLCSVFMLSQASAAWSADAKDLLRFKVTVHNLTVGNAISPFLGVVQAEGQRLFKVGAPATPGIAAIAETGSTTVLEKELADRAGVLAVSKVAGGPLMANEKRSLEFQLGSDEVTAGASFHVIAMIGRSNDSFISAPVSLAAVVKSGQVYLMANNFDAGSEENTGNVEDFGAGGHPTMAAEGFISYDRGLNPRGNAPDLLAWGIHAASVTVEYLP